MLFSGDWNQIVKVSWAFTGVS